MQRVSVSELKNSLSQYLRLVKKGEPLLILERGTPIARIEALPRNWSGGNDRIADLTRRGILDPPQEEPDPHFKDFFTHLPPVPCSADVVKILMEDREDRPILDQDRE